MHIYFYSLNSGILQQENVPTELPANQPGQPRERWFDFEAGTPEELGKFLAPLSLHPLLLNHCLTPANVPGVNSYEQAILVEFPIHYDLEAGSPEYLTLVLIGAVLLTIHPCPLPALDELADNILAGQASPLHHLAQLVYLIIDHLSDLNVHSQIEVRDKILRTAKTLTEQPGRVSAADLARLRWQVEQLVSLIENQLYCVTNLNASDNPALQESHRKAYLQDLVSEAEIAQKGVYRLETRMNDLYTYFQMAGNDRVEKRLRVLTIISAITLPLGLITGLLGMNVGGLPGTSLAHGFLLVVIMMVVIAGIEFWYFKRKGWFD
jgi:Mg2+ and Co2+ transporter CorA